MTLSRRPSLLVLAVLTALAGTLTGPVPTANAGPADRVASRVCAPRGVALGYSDALDGVRSAGLEVGGLSSLAYDRRTRTWVTAVDNRADETENDPARIYHLSGLVRPRIVGEPLVLRRPDGTPYDGLTADDEGLAVLPDGRYLVSSETEPSIRVFGRDGVQQASLPVPARFAVTGTTSSSGVAGEATANATLEGLTISPDGTTVVAAMEGALSGDVAGTGPTADARYHRFLVYTARHGRWTLTRQVGYRAETGQRIQEVAAYGRHGLVVEEASYDPASGNAVRLYRVSLAGAADVTSVPDLSARPDLTLPKTLLADLVDCPTLGARAKQVQANPLLDNYEGMAVTGRIDGVLGVTMISDDNFNPTQTTRLLDLALHVGR